MASRASDVTVGHGVVCHAQLPLLGDDAPCSSVGCCHITLGAPHDGERRDEGWGRQALQCPGPWPPKEEKSEWKACADQLRRNCGRRGAQVSSGRLSSGAEQPNSGDAPEPAKSATSTSLLPAAPAEGLKTLWLRRCGNCSAGGSCLPGLCTKPTHWNLGISENAPPRIW
jgi:hypothetical protein